MKISNNQKLIDRNKKIAKIVLYASLALLILGLLYSFSNTDQSNTSTLYLILIPAYVLVQISIIMANKWGHSPRPDEIVAGSLKGLNNQYSFYNYTTGVPQLLVGPAGVMIIKPYHQAGIIIYDAEKDRYKQKGGGNFLSKFFGQDGLSNIRHENKVMLEDFQKYVKKNNLSIDAKPEVVNIFFSDAVDLRVSGSPETVILASKLKDYVRQAAKKAVLSDEEIKKITDQLPEPNEK